MRQYGGCWWSYTYFGGRNSATAMMTKVSAYVSRMMAYDSVRTHRFSAYHFLHWMPDTFNRTDMFHVARYHLCDFDSRMIPYDSIEGRKSYSTHTWRHQAITGPGIDVSSPPITYRLTKPITTPRENQRYEIRPHPPWDNALNDILIVPQLPLMWNPCYSSWKGTETC